jgi:transporter family protein
MNYLIWALIALGAYSLVPPLSKLASNQIPIMTVALIANITITVVNLAIVVYLDERILSSVTSMHGLYALGAGAFLTIGVLSYFHALSIGPVSVVTPIFGLFLVGSAIIGMSFLGEAVTPRKLVGLGFAAIAVYLTST